jgi:hypothetical protein
LLAIGAMVKIVYDLILRFLPRHVKPPEEASAPCP